MDRNYKAHLLRERRLELGWSQRKLAQIADISHVTVGRVESGETEKPETVRKLAEALRVPMSDLVVKQESIA